MLDESYITCALPHSLAYDAAFHVSLFFSPTICPQAPATLSVSRLFLDWAEAIRRRSRVRLYDQAGDIPCQPSLQPVDPELWRALFQPETPVKSPELPKWDEPARRWRSFSARNVHDIARALHMATIYTAPVGKPRPSEHPLAEAVANMFPRPPLTHGRIGPAQQMPDERALTRLLDERLESGEPLRVVERMVAATGRQEWLSRIVQELHRCRRYYEPPELQSEYRAHPDPDASVPAVETPEPEFHARCALAGDHPELLRRLGLVVDLTVTDPARLRRSQWLAAEVSVGGASNACRSPRVRCHAVGDALIGTPQGKGWSDGALRLGDESLFSVLTLDTDGSALKAEHFLWTLARLQRMEANDAPVDAATPALRSPGFTIAAVQQAQAIQRRLARQRDLEAGFKGNGRPELFTEDVTRGLRVEVWDDHAQRWASLHHRLSTAHVVGFGDVYRERAEEAFIQGTAAHELPGVAESPVNVHDALFGWEGWSVSAPRPGKRIRHADGDEIVEDAPAVADDALVHPIRVQTRIAPGTLPRLRYGRNYAFRAWAVDLAGNSRAQPTAQAPAPTPTPQQVAAALSALRTQASPNATAWSANGLHEATIAALSRRTPVPGDATVVATTDFDAAAARVLRDPIVGPAITGAISARRAVAALEANATLETQVQRGTLVARAIAQAVIDDVDAFTPQVVQLAPDALASAVAQHAAVTRALPPGGIAAAITWARDTITALHPFLRWEPVPGPVLVPRTRYTEGESLRELVIRSGITQDPETLALTITPPADYVASANLQVPEACYAAVNERHVAPPKASQLLAELHGMFDEAIGSGSAAARRRMLGWILRENGAFSDTTRADIDHPPARIDQEGIALVHVGTPTEPLVEDLAALKPGDPLAPGQTVVHDTDDLFLPYLPDPIARGISLSFPDAGRDRSIPFPFGAEDVVVEYSGAWPEIEPFRMVLQGGDTLDGSVAGRVVTFTLPAGSVQTIRLASSMHKDDLDLMGPWRSLPDAARNDPDVAAAAADGLLWGLSPYEDLRLVHAVDRPVGIPRPVRVAPFRQEGSTHVWLLGAVEVHGPSTDNLSLEASWRDDIDDLTRDGPHASEASGMAFRTQIRASEDIALLSVVDAQGTVPLLGPIALHQARHELHDTHHRVIDYRFRASTRFREYFAAALLKPASTEPAETLGTNPASPVDDGQSVVGPTVQVSIPSSARPAAPIVHSMIPLFRWSGVAEPDQPLARRHVRRTGVRIYLERPWYSSGSGELLGVLLAPSGDDNFGAPANDGSGFPFVSKWGADPVWRSIPVANRALSNLQLDSFLRTAGLDDRWLAARPVTAPATLPLAAVAGGPPVTVLGYKPQFNKERGLWYVDVAIDTGDAFWPFVRLAVCRYQPDSIGDCHLSAPIRCDFVQLPPERMASVSRTDDRHVRVVVAGPVGVRADFERDPDPIARIADAVAKHRTLVASLQQRDPGIASDLGWQTRATTRLVLRGRGATDAQVAWVGELESKQVIALSRPEHGPAEWRVTIEEWEKLEADPINAGPRIRAMPAWEQRLIYADAFDL